MAKICRTRRRRYPAVTLRVRAKLRGSTPIWRQIADYIIDATIMGIDLPTIAPRRRHFVRTPRFATMHTWSTVKEALLSFSKNKIHFNNFFYQKENKVDSYTFYNFYFSSDKLKVKTEENLHRTFHIAQKPEDVKSNNNKNPTFAYTSNLFLRNRVTNEKFQRLKQEVDRNDGDAFGKVRKPSIFLEAPRFNEGRLNNAINSLPAKYRETESRVENVVTLLPTRSLRVPLISPPIRENEEFDPFYPKATGTTEPHYTPSKSNFRVSTTSTTRRPWLNDFVIPDKLPDLNNLEDLVDRRKYFFIPKVNSI